MYHDIENIKFKRFTELSDDRILALCTKIVPVIQTVKTQVPKVMGGEYVQPEYRIVKVTPTLKFLKGTSFKWDPKFLGKVEFTRLGSITTYHSYGYHMLFKPSIAEVLAQIVEQVPPDRLKDVDGFMLDDEREMDHYNIADDDHHFTKTHLLHFYKG